MAERAHVTSLEAIDTFRASLIQYLGKARPALEEVSSDVLRTRLWLETTQRTHWEGIVRRRRKELEQAQSELSNARFANIKTDPTVQLHAVRKARAALEHAEAKLKRLKQWNRDFDTRVEPLARQLDRLHGVLSQDMVEATVHLARLLESLAAYAEAGPGGASAPPPPTESSASAAELPPSVPIDPAAPPAAPSGGDT